MDEMSEREKVLCQCKVLLGEVEDLLTNIEELPEEASDEDINLVLASGIFDVEKRVRQFREMRSNPLLY